jgi:hypothetical protein
MFAPLTKVAHCNAPSLTSNRSLPVRRTTTNAVLQTPAMLQRSVGNQAVLRQGGQANPISQTGTSGAPPNAQTDCSGWNRDPQSLSKRAAEHYLYDRFKMRVPTADSITCSGNTCVVHYQNGNSPFDVHVYFDYPNTLSVMGSPPGQRGPLCWYSYSCDANNDLRFSDPPYCM